jgi:transposase-like protein
MGHDAPRRCSIEHVGKQRNGKPRFWCTVHQSSATGRYGIRLPACEGAYLDKAETRKILELDPADYPGGIALWGAVNAAYDTSGMKPDSGIHVHARGRSDGGKEIDDTFDAVVITSKRDLLDSQQTMVTSETAVNFYLSRFLKREIRYLRCTHCDEMHLDSGYFAIKPHRRHLCHGCGRYFNDTGKGISNPIASLHEALKLHGQNIPPVRAPNILDVRQSEYPGGMQIWASNPALIWTSERPEEEGLHVHLFRAPGEIVFDDTCDRVTVDGIELNESHVQHFMAQQALPHLANKVVSLKCPRCDFPHFDEGELGFFPHIDHECAQCNHVFCATGRRRLVVSNPFVEARELLREACPARN